MKNNYLFSIIIIAITFVCLIAYSMGQQIIRQSANLAPFQMANEAKIGLEGSESITQIFGDRLTDFTKSQMPFVIVYNLDKKPVSSTTLTENNIPQIPYGVLDSAKKSGQDRVTWQPQSGLRFATVVIPFKDGYIVGGQSLTEFDRNVQKLNDLVLAIWAFLIAVSVGGWLVNWALSKQKHSGVCLPQ